MQETGHGNDEILNKLYELWISYLLINIWLRISDYLNMYLSALNKQIKKYTC